MKNTFTTPTLGSALDPTHEHPAIALDYIQETKSKGFALAAFTPHLIVLILLLGALYLYQQSI